MSDFDLMMPDVSRRWFPEVEPSWYIVFGALVIGVLPDCRIRIVIVTGHQLRYSARANRFYDSRFNKRHGGAREHGGRDRYRKRAP